MRKYLLLYFSILFSLLMAHQACAQNSIEVETESTENFVSIRVDGITRLVFDFDSERVYNYDADGANDGSMALNDVVWGVSGGSSYAFSQRKSAISALTTATGALQIKHSQIPYDPYPCDLGPCPHGYTLPQIHGDRLYPSIMASFTRGWARLMRDFRTSWRHTTSINGEDGEMSNATRSIVSIRG